MRIRGVQLLLLVSPSTHLNSYLDKFYDILATELLIVTDNLNGAQILGRTIRVDHVAKYKKKEEEDEEAEQQKREARGVCRAFQRGECTRGAGCRFSHNEQVR